MSEGLSADRKERLLGMMQMVMEEDALEIEDESAILDICIKACKRKHTEVTEDYLKARFSESGS